MKKYISSFTKEVFNPSILFLQELPWSNPILLSKTLFGHFKRDSLYRNSIFLMLSTFIMSFFGFFFWTINARLYTTEQIGIATSLISLTTLLSSISILGLNTGIIRFLPKTKKVNGLLTAIFIIIITFSFVITTIYLGLIDKFSPKLSFLLDNMPLLLFFILVVVLTALNIFKDSIFIAFKNAHYSVTYNFVYSITRLASPVLLVSFGFIGIFIAHTIGIVSALLISFFYLVNKFSYTVSLQIEKKLA